MKLSIVGLKTATQYEIQCMIAEYEYEGNTVIHKTHYSKSYVNVKLQGKRLKYNGVLILNSKKELI
tara:strand:+ start:1815 stop:2012 length:198 start_codon:yes stop_codon:yes gene_type:complete